jgi:hypothetical protein
MIPEQYHDFTKTLQSNLEADPNVIGLILAGSTAGKRTPDQFSDHDFLVITLPSLQEAYRTNLTWLPNYESIVLAVRETEHGLKVMYQDGHLLEFAIFDRTEISNAKLNDYAVAIDRSDFAVMMERLEKQTSEYQPNIKRDLGMVPCLLLVGAGRAARGEILSASVFIKTYSLGHLLTLVAHQLPAEVDNSKLDNLDPFRRVEQVYPTIAGKIADALCLPPLQSALAILKVYSDHFNHLEDYPAPAVQTVQTYIEALV